MSYKCQYCGYVATKVTNYCVKCGKPREAEFVVISKGRLKELESNQKKNSNINERIRRILVSEKLDTFLFFLFIISLILAALFFEFELFSLCVIFAIISITSLGLFFYHTDLS